MEYQILAAYSKYIEPYYGPISEESKKTIANLVEIAKSFDFLPLKIDGKQGEVIVTLADTDPRFKDGGFNKSQGTIAITKDSGAISYNECSLNNGVPHDAFCTIAVKGDLISGVIHKPTKDFSEHVITEFNEDGIITTKADGKKEVVPYISDKPVTKVKEVYNTQTFKLDAINARKMQEMNMQI